MTITLTFWDVYGWIAGVLLLAVLLLGRREELGPWGYPDPTLGAMVAWLLLVFWGLVGIVSLVARSIS